MNFIFKWDLTEGLIFISLFFCSKFAQNYVTKNYQKLSVPFLFKNLRGKGQWSSGGKRTEKKRWKQFQISDKNQKQAMKYAFSSISQSCAIFFLFL